MAQILDTIHQRAGEAGIHLQTKSPAGDSTFCVTWVDDVALAVMEEADQLVAATSQLVSIVMDVTIEHGMRMSYGQGKTAVILEFRGKKARQSRQKCEKELGDHLTILSEHEGMTKVPLVTHYKHLGGQIMRGGSLLQEIKIRGAAARQNVVPLKTVLSDDKVPLQHRRMLVKSMGLSVMRLHAGTWFAINQGELQAWTAALHRLYRMLDCRDTHGEVKHKKLYHLAAQMEAPMPVELIYLERLRLFGHLLHVFDEWVITAILHNHRTAGSQSWLHGLMKSMEWAQTQIGAEHIPDELLHLDSWQAWQDFRDAANMIKKQVGRIEAAHLVRIKTYVDLHDHAVFQADICKEMGWCLEIEDVESGEAEANCDECGKSFGNFAALAAHKQRKHKMRMAVRRFAKDGICRSCGKNFHARRRLLQHLHWSGTRCWIYHMRCFAPMTLDETQSLDDRDRQCGQALHQHDLQNAVVEKMWTWASESELCPVLQLVSTGDEPIQDPTQEEVLSWAEWGSLPPGFQGKPRTVRNEKEWKIHNLAKDTSTLEKRLLHEATLWSPNHDWVPRPLATGEKFFLNLFSGHRRYGDLASWFQWDGRVIPISVDFAVDSEAGDALQLELWFRLIAARKVIGAHAGPPCETYTAARWNEIAGKPCPRPLRDAEQPWGKLFLTLKEVQQCHMGTLLMLTALKVMLMTFAYGGSFSLEHPAGNPSDTRQWCIWQSAAVKWLMQHGQVRTVRFLQGPLGQKFAKPTTLLTGRLPGLASLIFQNYTKGWKATEVLCGKEGRQWKTAKAKAYPERMSQAIALAHLQHLEGVQTEGTEEDPEELPHILERLAQIHDPYDVHAKATMMADYHRRLT